MLFLGMETKMTKSPDFEKIEELEKIYNHAPIGLCVFDLNLRYKRVNKILADMGGFSIEEHIGHRVTKIIPELGDLVERVTQQVFQSKSPVLDITVRGATAKRPDVKRTYRWSCYPILDSLENITAYTFIVEDITDKQRAEQALIESEKRFREIADKAPLLIWISNQDKKFTYLSRGWADYIGNTFEIFDHDGLSKYIDATDFSNLEYEFNTAYEQRRPFSCEFQLRKGNGTYRWHISQGVPQFNDLGDFSGFIGSAIDVHDIKAAEIQLRDYKIRIDALNKTLKDQVEERTKELMRLALYNNITNFPNRNSLIKDVEKLLLAQKHTKKNAYISIVSIDLDNFTEINDFFGRSTADNLLIVIANTLKQIVSPDGDVYHMGGDKFAVILNKISNREDVRSQLDLIVKTIERGWLIDENIIFCGCCIGACISDETNDNASSIMAHADMALSIAKKDGLPYVIFENEMEADLKKRILIAKDLRRAVEFNQFFLLFQPQINSESGEMSGLEALIRWNHPTEGVKKPHEFIHFAEDSRVIIQIGNWVIKECCRHLSNWIRSGIEPPSLSLNISPYQLQNQTQFIEFMQGTLLEYRVPANKLEIEITEHALLDIPDKGDNILHEIKRMGIKISLDDFGTGYASLDYLSKFPVDRIKIAQNFVSDVIFSERNRAIIEATMTLAQKLAVEVIVEGVETREQLQLLSSIGCKEFQGYYFSEPISARMITEMLSAKKK